jgi:hypothetical protein
MSTSNLKKLISTLVEEIVLDIEIDDIILGGKFKNKRIVVKSIGKDELGQPTINGKSILKVRIEKDLPDDKKSKKTKEEEQQQQLKETITEIIKDLLY